MLWRWYECPSCKKRMSGSESEWLDDLQSPFGPERVCPDCREPVSVRHHPFVIAVVLFLGAAIGVLAGSVLR